MGYSSSLVSQSLIGSINLSVQLLFGWQKYYRTCCFHIHRCRRKARGFGTSIMIWINTDSRKEGETKRPHITPIHNPPARRKEASEAPQMKTVTPCGHRMQDRKICQM